VIAEWLRDNAHRLRTDDDRSDLEPLRDIVGDARVVAIGESTHRIHEFHAIRGRLTRFLAEEMGFTAFVLESGFPEGLRVDDWVRGGADELDDLLRGGITYHMGKCAELRDQLQWMRAAGLRFYGMDVPDSAASARPAVEACLSFLDDADPDYAAAARTSLLPLFGYLPDDRTGLAWSAPALHAYLALDAGHRNELTARIGELAERLLAQRVVHTGRTSRERVAVAGRCAATARHTDAFLQAMAAAATRTYAGANIRDAAMAENVEWILGREERIVVAAANGHVQRWPFAIPGLTSGLTTVGEHLAAALGDDLVVVATAFGGGELFLHRPIPGGPPGHTETFTQRMTADEGSVDALLATAGLPHYLLDLRTVPASGPVADAFAAATTTMTGMQATPVDPVAAFDAIVYVDEVTPWHTFL
jgi:erythromycin esterase